MREGGSLYVAAVRPATRAVSMSMEPFKPEPWTRDALCAETDPEAFFPEKGGSTRDAKKICAACDVVADCLEYALEHDERFGIWGALSERERRKLRRAGRGYRPSITNGAVQIGGQS